MLATATLFARPGEVVPALAGFEFFFYLIMPCILLSMQLVSEQLSSRNLQTQPITVCVLPILPIMVLSSLAHFDFETEWWVIFAKNVMYYCLLVSLVSTGKRFRQFIFWLWAFSLTFAVMVLLQYHEVIHLNIIKPIDTGFTSESGEAIILARMSGSGIFTDPNDMCLVIDMGFLLSLYLVGDGFWKLVLGVSALPIFGYALMKTQSRGGFIALLAGCAIILLARYGWKKGAMLGAVALPMFLAVFKGRLTTISTHEGTAHSRIGLWSDGLEFLKSSPIFGTGVNKYHFLTQNHHVAHNSYLHAFVELGPLGGTFFTGAFFFALWAIYRMGDYRSQITDPSMRRMQPYVMAVTTSSATLMMTVSQTYYTSTYLILGMATAYLKITNASNILQGFRVNSLFFKRLTILGVCFITALYIFVQAFK